MAVKGFQGGGSRRSALRLRLGLGLGGLGVVLAGWFYFEHRRSPPPGPTNHAAETGKAVDVLEARVDHLQDIYPVHGTVEAEVEVPLHFETEGIIDSFDYGNGDRIGKGELIAKLDQSEVSVILEDAEIDLRKAENLFKVGALTMDELRRAQLKVKKAAIDLRKTFLVAPTAGVLSSKEAVKGQFVTPAAVVARILSVDSVRVLADIPEKAIDNVAQGQKVRISVATYPDALFWGRVGRMEVKADHHSYQIEVRLKNEGALLLPGMMAKLEILVFEAENAIGVPPESLFGSAGAERLFVAEEGKARVREVTVGYRSSRFALIESGLAPGDDVIVRRPYELADGDSIRIGSREP